MPSMIQSKAKARVEEQMVAVKNIAITAHINNKAQRTLHAEFVKDFFVQTVAVNVWVAT